MDMSSEENTEKTKTLAELPAESLNTETLMADAGTGPGPGLPDEVPRVSQVDHEPVVNGNVDPGATSEPVVASGDTAKGVNEVDGDGISLLVDVHCSLENVKGMNGEENVDADDKEDEMVDAVDGDTAEDNNDREDTNVYKVGDFVWGKVTSHPWWPGRVYDSSCASEKAMKYYRTDGLLVAYFGDFSYSFRPPSQLVPFVENFEQMSKQSTSKSFLNAVQKAVDEISILMEFDMCITEDSRAGLSWPLAENGGIKKGVPVPEGVSAVRFLLSQYEPAVILKGLKHLAQNNFNSNILGLAVMKGWLPAFYRAKCGWPLALYCEPVPVEGLEDKKKDQDVDANDFSVPIEVPIQGPSEEETPNSGLAKSPMTAPDKIYHKRKQKSVAELMGENAKPKGKKKTAEDSTPSSAETSDKKRKKSSEKANSVDEKIGKRDSKKSGDTDLAKKKELSVSIPEHDELGNQRDMNASPLSRERKKSKYLSPPYMSPKWNAGKSSFKGELEIESQKVSDISRMGERMRKAARDLLSSPDANHGNEAVKAKKAERLDDVDKSSRIGKRSSGTSDTMNINSSVNEVLSEVQSTALSPLSLRNGSVEKAKAFVSSFRNSVYLDGSNYKQYHKKTGKKRKSVDDTKSPESIPSHAKKRKTKASGPSSQGTEDEEDGIETSSVILMVTFATGVSLPSEDEIIRIYNKFGDLNEKETKVLHDSNSVQIVYIRGSDTQEAFKESVKQSPFGAADVNFKLTYPSSNSETPLSSLIAVKGKKSEVQLIKQKLKGMTPLLEKCQGKITTEEKAELENEIKSLLEKVSTVSSTNP